MYGAMDLSMLLLKNGLGQHRNILINGLMDLISLQNLKNILIILLNLILNHCDICKFLNRPLKDIWTSLILKATYGEPKGVKQMTNQVSQIEERIKTLMNQANKFANMLKEDKTSQKDVDLWYAKADAFLEALFIIKICKESNK